MKRFKKIIKWVVIVLLVLITGIGTTIALRQNRKFDAPYPVIKATSDSAVIARGKHIVYSQAHCGDCHSTQNVDSLLEAGVEPSLSGGRLIDIGIAKIYTPNLTSDSLYGIGKKTDGEIARVLRYGVHTDGRAVLNFMEYTGMSDEDLQAVLSYVRTQKPDAMPNKDHEFGLIGKAVKAFMIEPVGPKGSVLKRIIPDSSVAYGAYLVNNTSNCGGCHTQRDLAGSITGPAMAGGNNVEGFITPNITSHKEGRINKWSEQQFIDRFREPKKIAQSPMPWTSYRRMTDLELKAIYRYLKSVPPSPMPALKN